MRISKGNTLKVSVTVKPNSKKESVTINPDGSLVVRVNAPPVDGAANERVIELLAEHFNRAKSKIELISGHQSKHKRFEIHG